MEKQVDQRTVEGIRPKQGCPVIDHLIFADDSLFFMEGVADKARNLKRILEHYCNASGQRVNFAKSNLYFNMATDKKIER